MSADATSYSAGPSDAPPPPTRRDSRSALVRPRPPSPPPEAGPSSASATNTSTNDKSAAGQEKRPAAKRARKAVNCDPCRTNKLKCDRNRPCSSCELRGTVSQCYQDGRTPDPAHAAREDPIQEIGKIRKSLASLEQFVLLQSGNAGISSPEVDGAGADAAGSFAFPPDDDTKVPPARPPADTTGPGSRGRQAGGLYNGPTSISTHLIGNEVFDSDPTIEDRAAAPPNYDSALLAQLPESETVNGMLDYYFTHGRWLYRHVWEPSFRAQWDEYTSGRSSDDLVLATCCALLALSTVFLPERHPLKQAVASYYGTKDAGQALYDLALRAESRYKGKGHSLECLEFTLVRAHWLLHATHDGEEIWAIRGQMVSTALAMGLHRDPSQWAMAPEVAERRRWLWWTILCYERWQAFLLGRPLAVAGHHFDTQLPSAQLEPAPGMPGCTYAAALALFRLGAVLGGIIDDALALRPVPYARVQRHDRALVQWMAGLPPAWELSEAQLAAGLRSDDLSARRLVVQALCLRLSCYHIRLTLHRPYASRPATPLIGLGLGPQDVSPSAEIAISSAEQLLSLAAQYRKHALDDAVPGHFAFVSFQIFSAAMFTAFQLIAAPAGTHAERHRLNIARAMEALRATAPHIPGGTVARQAVNVLDELAVLWSDRFVKQKAGAAKEAKKQGVLARVRTLAFPFHTPTPGGAPVPAPPAPEAAVFGSRGTVRPDMSYSGRTAAQFPPAPPQPPPLSVQVPTQAAAPGPYSAEVPSSAAQWSQQPPPPHDPVRRMSAHAAPEYWPAYGTPPPPQQLPPSATVPLQAQPFPSADERGFFPTSVSMPMPVGMPWGASIGIDPHEWTAFTQTMGPAYPLQQQQQQQPPHQQQPPMQGVQQQQQQQPGPYGVPPPHTSVSPHPHPHAGQDPTQQIHTKPVTM